jgi:hypothetical protein
MPYLPDPELIPPCPGCGDNDAVQVNVVGFPPHPPAPSEAERVRFLGCIIRGDTPEDPWWCPACERSFPWTYPFERTLLVKEPWVSLLLDGEKVWELRRSSTKARGRVGLTRSGSGVIAGRANLRDVHGPFTAEELRAHRDEHLVDDEFLDEYAAGKPLYAWELRAVHRYSSPAPYRQRRGAGGWVNLPLGPTKHCYFCDRAYPSSDPYHIICPEFPTGWDTPGLDADW